MATRKDTNPTTKWRRVIAPLSKLVRLGIFSTFCAYSDLNKAIYTRKRFPHLNYYYFEASISPIKYATFQLLGHLAIIAFFDASPLALPASPLTSAKMGGLGGLILGAYYLVHLFICKTWFYEGQPLEPTSTYVVVFAQEALHSGIAALLGAAILSHNNQSHLASMAIVGLLGPASLACILIVLLGVPLVLLCSLKYFFQRQLAH